MFAVFWFLARFAVVAAIICLFTGHTCAAVVFGFAWVFCSAVAWILTSAPDPERPTSPTARTSLELTDGYWEASAELARTARQHRSGS